MSLEALQTCLPEGVSQILPWLLRIPLVTPTLPPATQTNAYWVGEQRGFLVDPGSPFQQELTRIEQILHTLKAQGRTLTALFLTHHHPDHVGAVPRLQEAFGVPVLLHPITARCLGTGPRGTPSLDDSLQAPILIQEGSCLTDYTDAPGLELLHTPGHAAGHLCLFAPDSRTLIAGDMVASVGTILIAPGEYEGDMSTYLLQLERLLALAPTLMLPAHGDPITAPVEMLSGYIAHRRMREGLVIAALQDHVRDERALAREVYGELPEAFLHFGQLSLVSHLTKLEREGRAVQVSGGWRRAPV